MTLTAWLYHLSTVLSFLFIRSLWFVKKNLSFVPWDLSPFRTTIWVGIFVKSHFPSALWIWSKSKIWPKIFYKKHDHPSAELSWTTSVVIHLSGVFWFNKKGGRVVRHCWNGPQSPGKESLPQTNIISEKKWWQWWLGDHPFGAFCLFEKGWHVSLGDPNLSTHNSLSFFLLKGFLFCEFPLRPHSSTCGTKTRWIYEVIIEPFLWYGNPILRHLMGPGNGSQQWVCPKKQANIAS